MYETPKPILTKREEQILRKIQKQISHCLYDQPYDGGEVMWLFGEETDMDDLFWNNGVTEKMYDRILSHLSCPSCGFENFEMGFRVGTKTHYDLELEKLYEVAKKKYLPSFIDLEEKIKHTPLLAYKNSLAKKIHKELSKGTLNIVEISGTFFRARKASTEKYPFTPEDMLLPDWGIPSEGRYNHNGHPHLYLSEKKETAEAEVLQDLEESIEIFVQEFEIKNPFTKILDLSHDYYEINLKTPPLLVVLFNFIEKRQNNKKNYKPDYYIPRFIADCAKDAGYEGIKYASSLNHNGFNVVLFSDYDKVTPIGNPISIVTEEYKKPPDLDIDW